MFGSKRTASTLQWSDTPSEHQNMKRRQLLKGIGGSIGTLLIAGCSATESSSTADCTTEVLAHGEGEILQEARVRADGEELLFEVVLTNDAIESGAVDRIAISDGFGNGFVVPTSDRRTYAQHLGQRPLHKRYRIVAVGPESDSPGAVGASGPKLDEMTIEIHCPQATP